ncbi:MAG: hypothetical protein PHF36_00390 [Candidatus Cloacimonetes bacterium]|nr:hypothetical protein [Candidatus Cloacimonadota bacterium]
MKKLIIILIAVLLIGSLFAEKRVPQVRGKIHNLDTRTESTTPEWKPIVSEIVVIEFLRLQDESQKIVYQCIAKQDGTFSLSPKTYHDPAFYPMVRVICRGKSVVQETKEEMMIDVNF